MKFSLNLFVKLSAKRWTDVRLFYVWKKGGQMSDFLKVNDSDQRQYSPIHQQLQIPDYGHFVIASKLIVKI